MFVDGEAPAAGDGGQGHEAMNANDKTLRVQIGAVGIRTTWLPVADFAAASRACREFI